MTERPSQEPRRQWLGLRGVAINDADGNPICCCACGCEKRRPPHWDRCAECSTRSHREPARTPSSVPPAAPLDVERLAQAIRGLVYDEEHGWPKSAVGFDAFIDGIAIEYARLSSPALPKEATDE